MQFRGIKITRYATSFPGPFSLVGGGVGGGAGKGPGNKVARCELK